METLTTKLAKSQANRDTAALTALECKALYNVAGFDVAKLAEIAETITAVQYGISVDYFGCKPQSKDDWLLKKADFNYYAAQANAVSLLLEQMNVIITGLQAAAEQGEL